MNFSSLKACSFFCFGISFFFLLWYLIGARYYDPELGIWLSVDAAEQFANAYGYATNPVILIDEDGNSFIIAALIGTAIGAAVGASTYSIGVAATDGKWNWSDFGKAFGLGALGGAITGGFGSLGTSLGTNILYNTIGSVANYSVGTGLTGGDFSAGGFAGAMIGGVLGGFLPSYQAQTGGWLKNLTAEMAYGTTKGAGMGLITGGVEAAFNGKNVLKGMGMGMGTGALGGAVSTAATIATFGTAIPTTTTAQKNISRAERFYGVELGKYGPTTRSGHIGKLPSISTLIAPKYGVNLGQNAVAPVDKNGRSDPGFTAHENIHYIQQIKEGPLKFYSQTMRDYIKFGGTTGSSKQLNTYEFFAEFFGNF